MSIAKHFLEMMAAVGDSRSWQQKIAGDFAQWPVAQLYEFALLDTDKEKILGIVPTTKEEREVLKRSATVELQSRGIPREQWRSTVQQNSALN